jgi:DNA (cytosine-5)-methyltransferase 1
MRYGSLFSGYGGLDMAIEAVFGAKAAWHAEIEPAPCKVLEARWPGVPNLGDVRGIDWSTVERPEILCGGFPCTDLSAAGKRAGLNPLTRSGLWLHFARAIKELRPELVVIENVRGLLSTVATHPAHQLGFCPGCLGDEPERVVLRALGAVLGDLADLGFDAEWVGLRASDTGAAHPRFRIFVLAWPAAHQSDVIGSVRGSAARNRRAGSADESLSAQDANIESGEQRWPTGSGEAAGGWSRPEPGGRGGVSAADPPGDGLGSQFAIGHRPEESAAKSNLPSVARGVGNRREQGRTEPAGIVGRPDAPGSGLEPVSDTSGVERRLAEVAGPGSSDQAIAGHAGERIGWGDYGPAIARWGSVIGRPAPAPTFPGKNGQPKLSPFFVEWLMGLPDGWVTGVDRISVNEWLKMLGNGVVPQQAEAGIRCLYEQVRGEIAWTR